MVHQLVLFPAFKARLPGLPPQSVPSKLEDDSNQPTDQQTTSDQPLTGCDCTKQGKAARLGKRKESSHTAAITNITTDNQLLISAGCSAIILHSKVLQGNHLLF